MLAARVHSEASVSSPTIRFYRPSTELQVVSRENGWLQLLDPVTQERGWVFEKYLVSIDGPSPIQAAMQSTTEPPPAKVAPPKSQKPSRSSKPTVRAGDVEVAKSDRRRGRWARSDDRRRGLGLIGFFRGRKVGPAAWSIGSAR
ncbi:MAG: SH3 domain-containing protein [Acidobacteriota bacterium]